MRHSSRDLRAVIDIIDFVYSIPDRASMFRAVCEKLERLIGISSAVFVPIGAGAEDYRLRGYELFNSSEGAMLMYLAHYATVDPFVIRGLPTFANSATRITDIEPKRLLLESEFARDFLIPMANVFYILGSTLVSEGDTVAVFGLHRERGDADFSVRDRSIVNMCLPHIARASRDSGLMKSLVPGDAEPGLIIMEEGGRVLYMNKEARGVLRGRPPSTIPVPGAGPAFLKNGSITYRVRTLTAGGDGQRRIILFERHPSGRRLRPILAGWNLSAREEEVAALVVQGLSNREIAEKLFITEQTVKDHLHEVFNKTGVRRRSELAAKALGIAAHGVS